MRGFGVAVLIVGVIWLIAAMNMDVSVSTGIGRVNNIGLMSQRSNHTMIGAVIALAGLLMVIFGGSKKQDSSDLATIREAEDSRPCPMCAEPIKHAAILCKHCGSAVDPAPAKPLNHGWTVRVPCRTPEVAATTSRLAGLGYPLLPADGSVVVLGFYEAETEAKAAQKELKGTHHIHADLYLPPHS